MWNDNTHRCVALQVNVLAFVTEFIPMEVINYPKQGSIIFHPSLLPKHRGACAINWTIMDVSSVIERFTNSLLFIFVSCRVMRRRASLFFGGMTDTIQVMQIEDVPALTS
jgi:hypothetical protein